MYEFFFLCTSRDIVVRNEIRGGCGRRFKVGCYDFSAEVVEFR